MRDDLESKSEELRKLYAEIAKKNQRKKELEAELLDDEKKTGKIAHIARKRKSAGNMPLSVTLTALILGCSRDRVYRLLADGILKDLHPVSVGRCSRIIGTYARGIKHADAYQQWKAARQAEIDRVIELKRRMFSAGTNAGKEKVTSTNVDKLSKDSVANAPK